MNIQEQDTGDTQQQRNRDDQHLDSSQHRPTHQYQSTTRNPGSRTAIHQIIDNSSNLHNQQRQNQGNLLITNPNSNYDVNMQDNGRRNIDTVRTQTYQTEFPKISSNFDRPNNRNRMDKIDPPLDNAYRMPKKDQPQEPAPYTVVQTYADRL